MYRTSTSRCERRCRVNWRCWDLSGQGYHRDMWLTFCSKVQAVIFVVDATDKERAGIARRPSRKRRSRRSFNRTPRARRRRKKSSNSRAGAPLASAAADDPAWSRGVVSSEYPRLARGGAATRLRGTVAAARLRGTFAATRLRGTFAATRRRAGAQRAPQTLPAPGAEKIASVGAVEQGGRLLRDVAGRRDAVDAGPAAGRRRARVPDSAGRRPAAVLGTDEGRVTTPAVASRAASGTQGHGHVRVDGQGRRARVSVADGQGGGRVSWGRALTFSLRLRCFTDV